MAEMQETGGILDGILAVTHPELYEAGRALMQQLYTDNAHARALVNAWPSVYHAVHVIVNRETLQHRDKNGLAGWFDLLLTVGTYGEEAVLSMRTFGVSVPYDSGSIVMIPSRTVLHGVPPVSPDRVCLAWLMKADVLAYHHIACNEWSLL